MAVFGGARRAEFCDCRKTNFCDLIAFSPFRHEQFCAFPDVLHKKYYLFMHIISNSETSRGQLLEPRSLKEHRLLL